MKTRTPNLQPADIERVAAKWILRRDAGLTTADVEEFARWRSADPRHEEIVARKEKAWAALGRPLESGQAEILLQRLAERAAHRRRRALVAAAAVLVLAVGGLSFQRFSSAAVVAHGTVLLPETRTLSDGSVVDLRPGAALTVNFGETRRVVRLASGAAHFQVAENRARPFVVQAGSVEFRAVGTAFSVELARNHVELLVTHGRVAVEKSSANGLAANVATAPRSPAQTLAQVDAGNRMVVELAPPAAASVPQPTTVTSTEMNERLAWRVPRLEFSELPLADAVQLVNRYNRVQFVIPDADVARLRISGLFRADNIETFVRLLEGTCSIQAERSGDVIVLHKVVR